MEAVAEVKTLIPQNLFTGFNVKCHLVLGKLWQIAFPAIPHGCAHSFFNYF